MSGCGNSCSFVDLSAVVLNEMPSPEFIENFNVSDLVGLMNHHFPNEEGAAIVYWGVDSRDFNMVVDLSTKKDLNLQYGFKGDLYTPLLPLCSSGRITTVPFSKLGRTDEEYLADRCKIEDFKNNLLFKDTLDHARDLCNIADECREGNYHILTPFKGGCCNIPKAKRVDLTVKEMYDFFGFRP